MASSFGTDLPPIFANSAFCSSNDTIAYCFQPSSIYYNGLVANGTVGIHITIDDQLLSVPILTFNIVPDPNNDKSSKVTMMMNTKTGIFLDDNNIPTRVITKESVSNMNSLVSSSSASISCNPISKTCEGVAFSKLVDESFSVYLRPSTSILSVDFLVLYTDTYDWSGGFYSSSNPQQGCAFQPLDDNYLTWPTSAPILCGHTLNKQWNSTSSMGDFDTSVYINGKQQESIPLGSYQLDW